ncbi:MAG TPA: glycosyltransferase, partial [Gemmatimonadaceae bacterium]|nr:glycosyltransferase [Gemmatimonadaceae bacterium]
MTHARPRVLYLQYANPAAYPPLTHSSHLLADQGADVAMLGIRPRAGGELAMDTHVRIRRRDIPEGSTAIGRKLSFGRFTAAALLEAARWRPDWIYVSDAMAALAGGLSGRVQRVPILYHEHDVHTEAEPSVFIRACMRARARLVRGATIVVVPSAGRAEFLRETLGRRDVHVVMNCPRVDDVRKSSAPAQGPLRLVYFGTIVPQRIPLALIEAIGAMRGEVHLEIIGYEPTGAEGHVRALLERAERLGVGDAVSYAGAIPVRTAALERFARCHLGLALVPRQSGDINMRTMAGASNKAFDYLACGVPMLVSDVEDWRDMFARPGYAR